MKSKKKIGIYLPIKDKSRQRDCINNPGIIDKDAKKPILEKIKKKFPDYEIIDNIDFKDFSIVNNDIIYKNKPLKLDIYLWYSHIIISYDSFHLHLLKHLSKTCKVIKNPFAEELGIDKFKAHEILRFNGLNIADYAFISSNNLNFAKNLLKKWESMVVKPRLGNYGVGVLLIDNFSTLRDLFGVIKETKNESEVVLLVERFYPHKISDWISVTVFNNKAIYGYRKKITKFVDKWKVFDDKKVQGDPSTVDYVNPPAEIKKAAEKASRVMNADVIGFDFIKTKEGYKIVDENTKPGFYDHCFRKAKVPIEDAFVSLL